MPLNRMRSNLDSRLSPSPWRYLLIHKGGKGERAWDRSKLPALETQCLSDPWNYNGIISHLISKRGGGGGQLNQIRVCCWNLKCLSQWVHCSFYTVDGGYSMWSPWLPCDADCGGGIQERNRFCNNPAPQIGGKDCAMMGSDKQTRLCNLLPCNVNFQWYRQLQVLKP